MKRFITILLVVGMLFCFTSCDDMTPLTDFMEKMGQNVLGMSTAGADKADGLISDLASKQEEIKVDPAKQETRPDGTVVNKVENKIGDIALEIKVPEKHTTTLPKLEQSQKDELVTSIGTATQNEASKKQFVEKMNKPAEEKAAKATQGSAAVASATVDAVIETVKESGTALPTEVTTTLSNLQNEINKFANKDAGEVTQADVAIIQLVDSFINTTVSATTEVKDGKVVAKETIDSEALVNEAATLYTAVNTLSSAASIDITAALDLMNKAQEAPATRDIAMAVDLKDYWTIEVSIDSDMRSYIDTVFNAVSPAFNEQVGDGKTKSAEKVLYEFAIAKTAYETYMTHATDAQITDKNNDEFNSLNNFIKYAITGALVEAQNVKDDILVSAEYAQLLKDVKFDLAKLEKLNVWEAFSKVYAASFADSAKAGTAVDRIYLPKDWFTGTEGMSDQDFLDMFKREGNRFKALKDQSQNASLIQMIDILDRLVDIFAADMLPEDFSFDKIRAELNMPLKEVK